MLIIRRPALLVLYVHYLGFDCNLEEKSILGVFLFWDYAECVLFLSLCTGDGLDVAL